SFIMASRNHKDLGHIFGQIEPGSTDNYGSGNFRIVGDNMYSYATPVAKMVYAADGVTRIMLVTCESYSNTTSKQLSRLWGTMPAGQMFRVPDIGRVGGQCHVAFENQHAGNLEFLLSVYRGRYDAIKRAVKPESHRTIFEHDARQALGYARQFGLTTPDIDPD